ncbi:hypothetical protein GOP47_0004863 [Adiantum capillus-veneris]|uniref:C2 domain-containing protein n=1 Tax=Adiantum capillus-veneris TaxID=13818 RepID=A0A9D4V4G5_ADICA|nr:hypothetical protein GOP47_0004863 [Adiantum capillus-veneris]
MEYRTLDVTVVSAEDLKKVTLFGKMQPYAIVWVDPQNRRTTRVDKDGHSNPSWNERLSFSVPEHLFHQPGSALHVEIFSKGSVLGNKFAGGGQAR